MKKKSLFRSFNAKLVLAVLAVSGALFTGCSKDGGLDIDIPGPGITPTPTDPTYSVIVSVVDAKTFAFIPTATVIGNGTSKTGAVTTFDAGAPGAFKVKATAGDAYKPSEEITVDVLAVEGNQSAVYPVTIYLQPTAEDPGPEDPETVIKDYNLTITVVDKDYKKIEGAEVVVTKTDETVITDLAKIAAGTYIAKASHADYQPTTTIIDLPTVYATIYPGEANDPINKEVVIMLYDIEIPPVTDATLKGQFLVGTEVMPFKSVKVYNANSTTLYGEAPEGDSFEVKIPLTAFTTTRAAGTATVVFDVVDTNNVKFSFSRQFGLTESGNIEINTTMTLDVKWVGKGGTTNTVTRTQFDGLPFTNDYDSPADFFIEYRQTSGKEVTLNSFATVSLLEKAAKAYFEDYIGGSNFTYSTQRRNFTIPAMTMVTGASISQQFTKNKLVPSTVIVTIGTVSTEGAITFSNNIYADQTVAGVENIPYPTTQAITHGHDHGHGHGGGSNPGGGIIEAE